MGVTSLQILQEKHPTEVQELFREIAVRLPKDSEESVGMEVPPTKTWFRSGETKCVEYEWGMDGMG